MKWNDWVSQVQSKGSLELAQRLDKEIMNTSEIVRIKWEYGQIGLCSDLAELNEYAAEGWRVINIVQYSLAAGKPFTVFLERELLQ